MTANSFPAPRLVPDDIRASLQEAATTRRQQLRALPPTSEPHNLVAAAHRQSVERILDAILDALDRLDAGTYGDCVECGGRIEDDRLRDLLWTTRCEWCATR